MGAEHLVRINEARRKTTLAEIRALFLAFPGIRQKEIANLLSVSDMLVGRYTKELRKEWHGDYTAKYQEAVRTRSRKGDL